MTFKRLAMFGAVAIAAFVSGCAVYPYPVTGQVVYGQPTVVYAQPAPVLVAPAPTYYYGPAFYPSISIHGRFGKGGHRHHHRRH